MDSPNVYSAMLSVQIALSQLHMQWFYPDESMIVCRELEKRDFPIAVVEDVAKLSSAIQDSSNKDKIYEFNFNNEKFCEELTSLISKAYERKL